MNTGDVIQIEVPDFDPDIDEALPTPTDQRINNPAIQGLVTPTLKSTEKVIKCRTSAPLCTDIDTQEVDWPDVIPVEIPPQYDQQNEQSIPTEPTYLNLGPAKIPQLEDNSEGEQYQDLETYLSRRNMFEASEHICRDYRSRLLSLDDDKYYQEIDRVYQTYETPPAQDYRLANQAPGPHQTTQELMQIFGKGRGQVHREELHGHRPFSTRTRSLQSHIQRKIRKTQWMRQRYANTQ